MWSCEHDQTMDEDENNVLLVIVYVFDRKNVEIINPNLNLDFFREFAPNLKRCGGLCCCFSAVAGIPAVAGISFVLSSHLMCLLLLVAQKCPCCGVCMYPCYFCFQNFCNRRCC
jgi:hypothetical protein